MINNIHQVLQDISLSCLERSYAVIGCGRWGSSSLYSEDIPDVKQYADKPKQLARAICQFTIDFSQGVPCIISNSFLWDRVEQSEIEDDEGYSLNQKEDLIKELDYYNSPECRYLLSKQIILELKWDERCRDAVENPFREINLCTETDLESIFKCYLNMPRSSFCDGFIFIVFNDFIIEPTWRGWVVYARRHADIEFVRWFYTLINHLCDLNPALLYASRDPLIDDYNPLLMHSNQGVQV